MSALDQLLETLSTSKTPDSLIDQVALNISEFSKDDRFYSIPFSLFQKIIAKTDVLSVPVIQQIFEHALASYSSLAYCLFPLIDCGKIGPQKALQAISPLMQAPLLNELKQIPVQVPDQRAQPTPQNQYNQRTTPQNQYNQRNTPQNQYNQRTTPQNQYNQRNQPNPQNQYNQRTTSQKQPQTGQASSQSRQNQREQPQRSQPSRPQPYSNENIHDACENGHLARVRQILEQNPKQINSSNAFSDKPLHKAVWGMHIDIVKYLLDHGADIECTDQEGLTPLHKAVAKKSYEITQLLLQKGANPSVPSFNDVTPIFTAASHGAANIVALLITAGANINAPSKYLDTPLHIAAKKGYKDICLMLCMQDANVNAKNNRNQTPYDLTSDPQIKNILVKYGYNPENRKQRPRKQEQEQEQVIEPVME